MSKMTLRELYVILGSFSLNYAHWMVNDINTMNLQLWVNEFFWMRRTTKVNWSFFLYWIIGLNEWDEKVATERDQENATGVTVIPRTKDS